MLQINAGNRYGAPETLQGIDPSGQGCTGLTVTDQGRSALPVRARPGGAPFNAASCTRPSAACPIPTPASSTRPELSAIRSTSAQRQPELRVEPRVTVNVALGKYRVSNCFWRAADEVHVVLGFEGLRLRRHRYVDPSYYVQPVGNVYNPADKVQKYLQYPYEPEFGPNNIDGNSTIEPFSAYVTVHVQAVRCGDSAGGPLVLACRRAPTRGRTCARRRRLRPPRAQDAPHGHADHAAGRAGRDDAASRDRSARRRRRRRERCDGARRSAPTDPLCSCSPAGTTISISIATVRRSAFRCASPMTESLGNNDATYAVDLRLPPVGRTPVLAAANRNTQHVRRPALGAGRKALLRFRRSRRSRSGVRTASRSVRVRCRRPDSRSQFNGTAPVAELRRRLALEDSRRQARGANDVHFVCGLGGRRCRERGRRTLAVANMQNDSLTIVDTTSRKVRNEVALYAPAVAWRTASIRTASPFSRARPVQPRRSTSVRLRDGDVAVVRSGRVERFVATRRRAQRAAARARRHTSVRCKRRLGRDRRHRYGDRYSRARIPLDRPGQTLPRREPERHRDSPRRHAALRDAGRRERGRRHRRRDRKRRRAHTDRLVSDRHRDRRKPALRHRREEPGRPEPGAGPVRSRSWAATLTTRPITTSTCSTSKRRIC